MQIASDSSGYSHCVPGSKLAGEQPQLHGFPLMWQRFVCGAGGAHRDTRGEEGCTSRSGSSLRAVSSLTGCRSTWPSPGPSGHLLLCWQKAQRGVSLPASWFRVDVEQTQTLGLSRPPKGAALPVPSLLGVSAAQGLEFPGGDTVEQ